jgi:hypothetical protein
MPCRATPVCTARCTAGAAASADATLLLVLDPPNHWWAGRKLLLLLLVSPEVQHSRCPTDTIKLSDLGRKRTRTSCPTCTQRSTRRYLASHTTRADFGNEVHQAQAAAAAAAAPRQSHVPELLIPLRWHEPSAAVLENLCTEATASLRSAHEPTTAIIRSV